jgi:glycosyltransferase involved in cell wall biosynthesis
VRPDVVHLNSSKIGVLGAIAARLARVPAVVFTGHGWAFNNFRSSRTVMLYRWGAKLTGRLTDLTICVSERERQLGLEAGACTAESAVVIHNAVDVAAAPTADPGASPARVITVGRLAYPKDFVTLVRAVAGIDASTVVAGDGPDRPEIEAEIARSGADVTLLGERDDVRAQLAASHVFVLSSRSEGLPMSIIEAMAAALPAVGTAVGGVPELIVDGETGFVVPAGDEHALRAALQKLVSDAALRARLGAAARERARRLFDLPAFGRAHVELYDSLLPKRARR